MNHDPFGLGERLYGFKVAPFVANPAEYALSGTMDAHESCWIASFCRAPLHPGPCKGWKKKLGTDAPGILKAIESVRKEKLAAKRKATAEAKSSAEKNLTGRQLASPLHAKKAKIKAANQILGDDEGKAGKKASRVILNKSEIAKYSKIKAAQIAELRGKLYGTGEGSNAKYAAYVEQKLAEALAKDNKTGKDTEYQGFLANLSQGMSAALADKMCKEKDGDCDGELYEAADEAAQGAVLEALKTGDPSAMEQVEADFKAGKIKPKETPASKGAKVWADVKTAMGQDPSDSDMQNMKEQLEGGDLSPTDAVKLASTMVSKFKGKHNYPLSKESTSATEDDLALELAESIKAGEPTEKIKAWKKALASGSSEDAKGFLTEVAPAAPSKAEANVQKLKDEGKLPANYDTEKNLAALKRQHAKGLMSDEEYEFEKANIEAGKPTDGPVIPPAPKKAAAKKAAATIAPVSENAAKGKAAADWSLGVLNVQLKGNKKAGTKAQLDEAAAKAEKWLDEGNDKGFEKTADMLADALVEKVSTPTFGKPFVALPKGVQSASKKKAQAEAVAKMKDPNAPTPTIDLWVKANQAQKAYNAKGVDEAQAGLLAGVEGDVDANMPQAKKAAKLIADIADYMDPAAGANAKVDKLSNELAGHAVLGNVKPLENAAKGFAKKLTDDNMKDSDWEPGQKAKVKDALEAELLSNLKGETEEHPILDAVADGKAAWAPVIMEGKKPPIAIKKFDGPKKAAAKSTPAPATPAPAAKPKHVQDAVNMANNEGSSVWTEAGSVAAYDKLSKDEFDGLDADVKKEILSDLTGTIATSTQPATKAKAIAVKEKLTGKKVEIAGPGAPATSTPATGKPASEISLEAQKASAIANGQVSMTATKKLPIYEALPAADFEQMMPNTQKLIMADLDGMEKKFLAQSKKDEVKAIKTKLSAGTGGGTGAGGGDKSANDFDTQLVGNLSALWFHAKGDMVMKPIVEDMIKQASTDEDYKQAASAATAGMGSAYLNGQLSKLGLTQNHFDKALMTDMKVTLAGDYQDALADGQPVPGGLAAKLPIMIKKIDDDGNAMASQNGWDADDPLIKDWKLATLTAALDDELADADDASAPAPSIWAPLPTGPATPAKKASSGAGGSSTAPNPSVSAADINASVGSDSDLAAVPVDVQDAITNDLKGFSTGKFLSDPKETTYGNLLALAAAYGTPDKPISVLQALKSVDASLSKKNGWVNANKWENEFVAWLGTPEGAKFAADNPNPDANLVKKLKGVYDGITTDLAELGKKVQLLPGPGPMDQGKPSSDFKVISTAEASKLRAKMLASQDGQYTKAQQDGIWVYTSNQFSYINDYLRGETSKISPAHKKALDQTQDAMRALPEDIIVHRGTGWDALPEGFRSAAGAKKLIGKTVMDEAFMSTSVGGAAAFGGQMLMEIECPKGTMAAYVDGKNKDGKNISSYGGEREMLLAAGQQYEVIAVEEMNSYQTKVRVRIVTP